MQFINNINQLTLPELIKIYIDEFTASKERNLMLKGDKYYKGENDILERKMYRFEYEEEIEDETKTNNRLSHAFMHSLVEDKISYLLTKPLTMECNNETYLNTVQELLGKRFQKKLSQLGVEASNKGISWLHPYIDDSGKFKMMKMPSEQIIPLWEDNDHEELQAIIRYFIVETYEGKTKKYITKIEYYTQDNVEYFVLSDGQVILDAEQYLVSDGKGAYKSKEDTIVGHFTVGNTAGSWGAVPFIPFKNNDFELPDLQFVKTLIDDYDIARSDVSNLLVDIKDIIFVLRGYGDTDLSAFVKKLAYDRVIDVDADGGVEKIEHTINIDAAKEHYATLKKDIFDFAQGVNKDTDKLGNSPSGIALKFLYSGLDLKCNALEDNFKWSFEKLMYFVNKYLEVTRQGQSNDEITLIFNRDIQINESEAITNCQNSMGVISNKTIVANHPFVTDADEELKQIEEENKSMEIPMFGDITNNGGE